MGAAFGIVSLLAIPLAPTAVAFSSVYLAHRRGLQLALLLASLVVVTAAGWAWRERVWAWPVERRFAEVRASDPEQPEVGVGIADSDFSRAWVALRRAKLLPLFGRAQPGGLPDAPLLDFYLAVKLPLTQPPADLDAIAARVRAALAGAGIRARVLGVDVGPGVTKEVLPQQA